MPQGNEFLSKSEEKPLTTCKECKDQPCIKTGKICESVEKMLPKPRSGGYRKEFSADPQKIEQMAEQRAFQIKYGNSYGQKERHSRHNRQAGD